VSGMGTNQRQVIVFVVHISSVCLVICLGVQQAQLGFMASKLRKEKQYGH
jgi:hypothetical protein